MGERLIHEATGLVHDIGPDNRLVGMDYIRSKTGRIGISGFRASAMSLACKKITVLPYAFTYRLDTELKRIRTARIMETCPDLRPLI